MVFLTNEHFTILNVKISFELSRKHHYIKKKQKSILFHHQKWKLNSCETISLSSYLQTSLWSSYSKVKYLVNCSSSLQLFALNLNKSTIRTYRKWSRNLTSYISNIAKVCGSGWFLFFSNAYKYFQLTIFTIALLFLFLPCLEWGCGWDLSMSL